MSKSLFLSLVLCGLSLGLVSAPRADDADDFFAIFGLPVAVNDQKYHSYSRADRYVAESLPSLFPVFVNKVEFDDAVGIIKSQRRHQKRNTAVLALILAVLPFIPLVAHLYIQIVAHVPR